MAETESTRIAHLTMIQGVVSRMAANSFTLKTLAVSFIGAWLAFMAATKEFSFFYILAPLIPTIMFWLLDAQYLRLERSYRKLYDSVRGDGEVEAYSLDFRPFSADVGSIIRIAFSWSLFAYYGVLVVLTVGLGSFLMWGEPRA